MSTFLIAFLIFLLAVAAMAVGLLISGKKLTRTCASGRDECMCAKARAEAQAAGEEPPAGSACQEGTPGPHACSCAGGTEAAVPGSKREAGNWP